MNKLKRESTLASATQYHTSGRLEEAAKLYRLLLADNPRHADALHLLGVLTGQQGNRKEAIELIQQAIQIRPQVAAYHNNLGNLLKDSDRIEDAIAAYRKATEIQPDYAGAHGNLGAAFLSIGYCDDAIASFRRALSPPAPSNPLVARWRNSLAVALARMNRLEESTAELRVVLRDYPDYPDAHNNLGLVLSQQGLLEQSVAAFRRAVEINPTFAAAYSNLGISLSRLGQRQEATVAYRKSIELAPANVMAYINFTQNLADSGEMDEAAVACQKTIELAPNFGGGYFVLGGLHRDTGRLDESLAAFDRAIELDPQNAQTHSGRIFARHFHAGSDAAALFQDQKLWDERHGQPLRKQFQPHENEPNPDRPLRVGYVSPNFTTHVLALTMLPLFSSLNAAQFEIYMYSDVARPGEMTDRFKACARHWRSIIGLSDQRVAEIIREDRIDILVDLTMHMQDNRLLVFARKPAPVQVTWAAYPGSTGLSAIDYRITDPYLDPPGLFEAFYSEQSLRLPDTFWCYDPLTDSPAVNPLPALENGYVTFGSMSNFCKLNGENVELWARIMEAVPKSRLLILSATGSHRQWAEDQFAAHGITADRIEHIDRCPRPQYLELYHRIDVCLDTLPYNGHTTSLDSFWMGVPVVTMVGPTVVGRAGLSELTNLGMSELGADTPDQFVEIAAKLCGDIERLKSLRAGLREKMEQSPLMDAKRFTSAMEAAYRNIWRTWCENAAKHDKN